MVSKATHSSCIALALALASWSSAGHAQGIYAGTWTVKATATPNWIEPTSPAPLRPAAIGAEVTFAPASVTGDETLACTNATYATPTLKGDEIFGSGIVDPALIEQARTTFSLAQNVQVLRVDCDKGVFDYHQVDAGTLVVLYDNLVYTLARKTPTPR